MQRDIIRAAMESENGNTILREFERMLLVEVLEKFNGNKVHSARFMKINRGTLSKRMAAYGIESIYK